MKAENLYQLAADPTLLTEETLPLLKQLVEEYPYFQIARILYLKNLALLKDIRFGAELKKMAICIPDRKKLFTLIEGERFGLEIKQPGKASDESDPFSLIDAFLSSRSDGSEETDNDTALLFQPSVSSDYLYWSLAENDRKEDPKPEETEVKLQHHDLIDSFIKSEEQRIPGTGLVMETDNTTNLPASPAVELEENQVKSLDDSYFTETLAHIYVKQKRYEKALQIIKNLNLKYPEKNVYFADQMRFLEKLIINTKK